MIGCTPTRQAARQPQGMMLANVPVIYLGSRFADRLPTKAVHIIASIIFIVLGGMALRNALMGSAVV